MKIINVAAAALIDPDNRILIASRPQGTFMPGFSEFPGGKIEAGETPEEALKRELMEELGIEICCLWPLTFISETREDHHVVVLLYVCREWEGAPQRKIGQELKWVKPVELPKIENMLPSNKPLISTLFQYLSFK